MTPNSHTQGASAPEPLRDYWLRKLLVRRQALADAAVEHHLRGEHLQPIAQAA